MFWNLYIKVFIKIAIMDKLEYIKRIKRIKDNSIVTFFSAVNNVVYTSPFFKSVSNQVIQVNSVITINENKFIEITDNQSFEEFEKENLYIARNNNGKLIGSIYIDCDKNILINYSDYEKQMKEIDKTASNLYKSLSLS